MNLLRRPLTALILLAFGVAVLDRSVPDDDKVWSAFVAWARTLPAEASLQGYSARLEKEGFSRDGA